MKKAVITFLFLALVSAPQITSAHSFGQTYSLPVPFWLYSYGAVLAMLLSFLFFGYFFNKKNADSTGYQIDLSKYSFFRFFTSQKFISFLKYFAFFLFVLTILTGLIGDNSSYSNFNMNFFWIFFVLGLTYTTAVFGDFFSVINPLKTLAEWLGGEDEEVMFQYPKRLGYFPATIFYFIFIWIELLGNTTPFKLSIILLSYTIICDIGILFFGSRIWFKYCEFFSVFFRLVGKVSPFYIESGKLHLRVPFVGLLKEKPECFSLVFFVVFMLSSTAFDGFRETLPWTRFYWGYINDAITPIFGSSAYVIFQTFGLFLALVLFSGIYLILIYLSKIISKSYLSLKDLSLSFLYSLIPIALVYNIAHYFTLLFTEGPNIVRLLSDPFGFNWNLFYTANNYNSFVLSANLVWHIQVALILIGHIVGVYLSHIIALKTLGSGKRAFWSQLPMLVLMIVYTVLGLWILSAPLTS